MNTTKVVRNPYAKKTSVGSASTTARPAAGTVVSLAPWNPPTIRGHDATTKKTTVATAPSTMAVSMPRTNSLGYHRDDDDGDDDPIPSQRWLNPSAATEHLQDEDLEILAPAEGISTAHLITANSKDTTLQQEPTEAIRPPNATQGNNIPIWQRLPSQSITFTSAEILTVSEVSERFQTSAALPHTLPSDNDPIETKSIRVTGVIWHYFVHPDASVSLILRDPLRPLPPITPTNVASRPTSILKRPRTIGSLHPFDPETPAAITGIPNGTAAIGAESTPATLAHHTQPTAPDSTATKTPSATAPQQTTTTTTSSSSKTATVVHRPQSSSLSFILQNNKKKKFLYQKPGSGRRLSFAMSGTKPLAASSMVASGGGGLAKRPLQRAHTVQNPLDSIVQAISGTVPCVWVVVNKSNQHMIASNVSRCVANDLAMVMGEVMALDVTPDNKPAINNAVNTSTNLKDDTDCTAVAQVLQKLSLLPGYDTDISNRRRRLYCLQARILRNVNGTDMRLFTDALLARRLFLQKQHPQPQACG